MKNVMVFFNLQPAVVQVVMDDITTVQRQYPGGEDVHLRIMRATLNSMTGDHTYFYVATDRTLTSGDIEVAAATLL